MESETEKRPEGDSPSPKESPSPAVEAAEASPAAPERAAGSASATSRAAGASGSSRASDAPRVDASSTSTKAASSAPRPPSITTAASGGPLGAYEAVARSACLPDLVAITQKVLTEAATARRAGWDHASTVSSAADDVNLSRGDADTPFGNALKVLGSGPEGEAERSLAAGLWAHAIAEARRDDEDRLAGDILWLATHTAFDATPLLDRALGDEADELWEAIADRVRRIDEGKATALGRGEAIVGCAALAASISQGARRAAADLAPKLHDPTLSRLLDGVAEAPEPEVRLQGEAVAPPRGPVTTAVLGLTGILFVMHAARLVAGLALAYRQPTEVSLSGAGVRVKVRTEMLGRVLRERDHVIARAGLVRVTREVRYPRAAFYAGLLALAVGSYVGVRAFADGVRAASPSLLLAGLAVVALGIAADFVLGSILPGVRGRVRVAFVPRTGKVLCVADVDAARADEALKRALSER
jgi:hypothetical protein